MILAIHHMDGRCIAETWFGAEWVTAAPVWIRSVIQLEFECARDDIGIHPTEQDTFCVRGTPVARVSSRSVH